MYSISFSVPRCSRPTCGSAWRTIWRKARNRERRENKKKKKKKTKKKRGRRRRRRRRRRRKTTNTHADTDTHTRTRTNTRERRSNFEKGVPCCRSNGNDDEKGPSTQSRTKRSRRTHLAIKLQNKAQHAVCSRVLWTKVDRQVLHLLLGHVI